MGSAIGQAATGQYSPRRRRHLSDASVSRLVLLEEARPPLFLCWVPVVHAELCCALQVTMVVYTSVYE